MLCGEPYALLTSSKCGEGSDIFYRLLSYTKKYLLIEFVAPEDVYSVQYLRHYNLESVSWYNKEEFEKVLSTYCRILETAPSDVSTRVLYLFERR